uniref:NACHT domain-containing protein n=1 Tax=Neolamprologus brichardi TaxID=32507 RepID=A0A3Q4G6K4_NEOBR
MCSQKYQKKKIKKSQILKNLIANYLNNVMVRCNQSMTVFLLCYICSFLTADVGLQEILNEHKIHLKRQYERVTEGFGESRSGTLLNTIYTELYITDKQSEEVHTQHEVRQLETTSQTDTVHAPTIKCHKLFEVLTRLMRPIRVVLMNGIAGIGKTFSVQKFIVDWSEGLENQDINIVILLSFRELNLIKDEQYSLLELLHVFYPTLQKVTTEKLTLFKLLFIFDGLDESRLSLKFSKRKIVSDITQTSSVNKLVTNLIEGKLLPSALIWITTRPAAANQIPPKCVDRVTEVRGFTDAQKEEYFRMRFSEKELSRVISHIKKSKNLNVMCKIPVFCWITATILEYILSTDQRRELPKTLTDMYSYFLLVQTKRNNAQELTDADKEVLLKLGKLAFENLKKRNIIFYQEDLEKCGLDLTEASVNSGVFTEIFKRECVIFQKPVYSFVHLSIQEFLAAAYTFHCYTNRKTEVLKEVLGKEYNKTSLDIFLSKVMEKSLQCKNGTLDLFVRFLHGLTLESNQRLLVGLLSQTENNPEVIQKIINNLKEIRRSQISPDRSIKIFHCLIEMNDSSVLQEIQEFLKSETKLSEIHCSALAYMLQMSEEVLDELDLQKFNTSDKGRHRLIPAVTLNSNLSHLKHLNLSYNNLENSGVKKLCGFLKNPHCLLETLSADLLQLLTYYDTGCFQAQTLSNKHFLKKNSLCRLQRCSLSEISCYYLLPALQCNPSHLKHLDLSTNNLQDSGVKQLCVYLKSSDCSLETLSLWGCKLSETSCDYLFKALQSNTHLRELDLTLNNLQESHVKQLSELVDSPHHTLEVLK